MNFQQNRLIFFQFFQPRYVGRARRRHEIILLWLERPLLNRCQNNYFNSFSTSCKSKREREISSERVLFFVFFLAFVLCVVVVDVDLLDLVHQLHGDLWPLVRKGCGRGSARERERVSVCQVRMCLELFALKSSSVRGEASRVLVFRVCVIIWLRSCL